MDSDNFTIPALSCDGWVARNFSCLLKTAQVFEISFGRSCKGYCKEYDHFVEAKSFGSFLRKHIFHVGAQQWCRNTSCAGQHQPQVIKTKSKLRSEDLISPRAQAETASKKQFGEMSSVSLLKMERIVRLEAESEVLIFRITNVYEFRSFARYTQPQPKPLPSPVVVIRVYIQHSCMKLIVFF